MKLRAWLSDFAFVVGPPALLALVELAHPQPHDLLNVDVPTWLAVHYAQIPLFPLAALSVIRLLRGRTGPAASISRAAMFVFGVGWTAWDAVAGVATGILANAARSSGTLETWHAPIAAIWQDPIMGGTASVFAVLGAIALSVGTVFAAITLKKAGSSWAPVLLLAISGFGITIFKTHAWPGGPLTFGGLAIAGAWLLLERAGSRNLPAVSTLILGLLLFAGCQRVAPWPAAGVFVGYYRSGFEHSDFRPAGTRERWWLTGEIGPLRHPPAPNPAYIVVRGALSSKGRFGHLARYERELAVKDIIEVRTLTRDEVLGIK